MDAGGVDTPIPKELFGFVDIFSPNETELARLTGMPTETFEQISQAAVKCHEMVSCVCRALLALENNYFSWASHSKLFVRFLCCFRILFRCLLAELEDSPV